MSVFVIWGVEMTVARALVALGVLATTAAVGDAWTFGPFAGGDNRPIYGPVDLPVYGPITRPIVEGEKGTVETNEETRPQTVPQHVYDSLQNFWQSPIVPIPVDQEVHRLVDAFIQITPPSPSVPNFTITPKHHETLMKWFTSLAPSTGSKHELTFMMTSLAVIASMRWIVKPFLQRHRRQIRGSRIALIGSQTRVRSFFESAATAGELAAQDSAQGLIQHGPWQQHGSKVLGALVGIAHVVERTAVRKAGTHFWKTFQKWSDKNEPFTAVHAAWANYRQKLYREMNRKTMPYGRRYRSRRARRRAPRVARYRRVRRRSYRRRRRRY